MFLPTKLRKRQIDLETQLYRAWVGQLAAITPGRWISPAVSFSFRFKRWNYSTRTQSWNFGLFFEFAGLPTFPPVCQTARFSGCASCVPLMTHRRKVLSICWQKSGVTKVMSKFWHLSGMVYEFWIFRILSGMVEKITTRPGPRIYSTNSASSTNFASTFLMKSLLIFSLSMRVWFPASDVAKLISPK